MPSETYVLHPSGLRSVDNIGNQGKHDGNLGCLETSGNWLLGHMPCRRLATAGSNLKRIQHHREYRNYGVSTDAVYRGG